MILGTTLIQKSFDIPSIKKTILLGKSSPIRKILFNHWCWVVEGDIIGDCFIKSHNRLNIDTKMIQDDATKQAKSINLPETTAVQTYSALIDNLIAEGGII